LDIYHDDPELYHEALNNPNMTSDIPNELKLLIRMLLSVDPNKRPSCNEILTKLKSLRRDSNAHIFQDIPTEWQHDSAASTTSTSSKRSFRRSSSPASIHEEEEEEVEEMELDEEPIVIEAPSTSENTIRKRQRLLDHDGDIRMSEAPDDQLLIESPDIIMQERSKKWLTEYQSMQLIKTITAVIKVKRSLR
jgi:serine/threonine protein kinase